MPKKRVFVSFDFDNDEELKNLLIAHARHPDSPFDVFDHSLKEAAPERDWEAKAELAIRRSELVVVMLGVYTHRASGVLKEVTIARRSSVPLVQVTGRSDRYCAPVSGAGPVYDFTWPTLKRILG